MLRFFTRLRFLPATIFAAVLMLSIKIGNIWEGLDGLVDGAISVAGAEAQQPSAAPPAAKPAAQKQPDAAKAETPMETPAEPGKTAEGASGSGIPLNDPTLLTQSEIDLLQQLAQRREKIEARERELDMRTGMLEAAESRIDKKVEELKTLQATVEKLIARYDDQYTAKIASLIKIYENMKPKDAARIFEELDMDTLLLVAERMKERKLAAVMAEMHPGKARDVTQDLAQRRLSAMANGNPLGG
jgi:flagellar motility protein MotE (MotC chaperone)